MDFHFRQLILQAAHAAEQEAVRIVNEHGEFSSLHEAYGVLAEEVAELFDIVRMKREKRKPEETKAELIQIAAVALKSAATFGASDADKSARMSADLGSINADDSIGEHAKIVLSKFARDSGNGLTMERNALRSMTNLGEDAFVTALLELAEMGRIKSNGIFISRAK